MLPFPLPVHTHTLAVIKCPECVPCDDSALQGMYNKLSTLTRQEVTNVIMMMWLGNHCYIYHELNWTLLEESHCSTRDEGHVNCEGFCDLLQSCDWQRLSLLMYMSVCSVYYIIWYVYAQNSGSQKLGERKEIGKVPAVESVYWCCIISLLSHCHPSSLGVIAGVAVGCLSLSLLLTAATNVITFLCTRWCYNKKSSPPSPNEKSVYYETVQSDGVQMQPSPAYQSVEHVK